jgi:hypothetical protein
MIFTLTAVILGVITAFLINKIEKLKTRKIAYWVGGFFGFLIVTVFMMAWANVNGVNPTGAPGASGLIYVLSLWSMAKSLRKK